MNDPIAQARALVERAFLAPDEGPTIAAEVLELLELVKRQNQGRELPDGYLYAGAYRLRAQVRDLVVEPLPEAAGLNPPAIGVPIFSTGQTAPQAEIKIPFDCLAFGLSSSCKPSLFQNNPAFLGTLLGSAHDNRDLFTFRLELDGVTGFSSDGRQQMMLPSSVMAGTGDRPWPLGLTLRRGQRIGVTFRSMVNAILGPTLAANFLPLAFAGVAFHCLNRDPP